MSLKEVIDSAKKEGCHFTSEEIAAIQMVLYALDAETAIRLAKSLMNDK